MTDQRDDLMASYAAQTVAAAWSRAGRAVFATADQIPWLRVCARRGAVGGVDPLQTDIFIRRGERDLGV